jgi:hypothetical protein
MALAVSLIIGAVVVRPDTSSASGDTQVCSQRSFDLPSGHVAGVLCLPVGGSSTLIITLAGGTYGRVYWDMPYQADTYSFVRSMKSRGYAVLDIDRLGIGLSDHPSSVQLTVPQGALSVHQIV